MSLWTDFRDAVESPFKAVGNAISGAVDSILHNPIGAITSAVAMAYGIPPAWAGALGGAAGAAATGGNVVKAAITGGAMGYMGQAAGAAAGSAGPIAAAAASGGAAGVTGAILTGQDVVTAMKQGLILGTVAGGVQQFMTPQEAMSKVSTSDLAKANLSSDPIGTLAKSQGWFDSTGATATATQALATAKSDGSLRAYYADQIPDSVLAKAMKTANPAQTVANEMGWSMSGTQMGGVYDALNDYKMASTPAVAPGTGTGANSLITPTNPTGAPGPGAPVVDAVPKPVAVAPGVDSTWSTYSQNDAFNPASSTTADIGKYSADYAQQELKSLYGSQANSGILSNVENPNTAYAKNLAAAEASGNPSQYLHNVGYNDQITKELMDYYNAKQYAQQQYTQEQTQYAAAHQATQPTVTDAGGGSTPPVSVEVGGVPKFSGMQGAGTPPSGFTVATPEQIWGPNDTGTASNPYTHGAYYDSQTNTWYAPQAPQPTTPTVPIVPPTTTTNGGGTVATTPTTPVAPPTVTPPTTTIPEVTVTAPKVDQPIVPIVVPPTNVQSGGGTSAGGTTVTTTPGTGGSDMGTITVTSPKEPTTNVPIVPPLTPPTTVTIPPGSSTVTPVETTTKTPTDTTTTTPPTDTTTPIVPIVVPKDPNNPDGSYHYGTYTLGQGNKVNVPTGLNPGWIAPTPYYQTTNDSQPEYYWGSHPYQPGPEFNASLYNNVPAAGHPAWGSSYTQTAATPQQIMQAMGQYYPLLGSVNGPVRP